MFRLVLYISYLLNLLLLPLILYWEISIILYDCLLPEKSAGKNYNKLDIQVRFCTEGYIMMSICPLWMRKVRNMIYPDFLHCVVEPWSVILFIAIFL